MTSANDQEVVGARTPVGLILAILISGLMTWRISAITYLSHVGDTIPDFWGIPFKGDAFIGFTAPVIAFLLYRYRNINIWTLGVCWQVVGLVDLYVALESQLLSPLGTAPYIVVPAGIVLHSLALVLLLRNRKSYPDS